MYYADCRGVCAVAKRSDAGGRIDVRYWQRGTLVYVRFPEPESGWADFFLANEDYRKLFAALARPNALELLTLLYSERTHYIVPEAAACRLGIPEPEAEEIFAGLYETNLLCRLELELASGMIYTYKVNENYGFVPFLLLARCLIDSNGYYYIQWSERESPLLRKPGEKR